LREERSHCSKQQWGSFKAQFGTFEVAVARGTFALFETAVGTNALFETAVGILQSTVWYLRSSSCEGNVLRCSKQQWGSFKALFWCVKAAVDVGTIFRHQFGTLAAQCSAFKAAVDVGIIFRRQIVWPK
jgi:hypothetical protein